LVLRSRLLITLLLLNRRLLIGLMLLLLHSYAPARWPVSEPTRDSKSAW
jgi:hypothetical protein